MASALVIAAVTANYRMNTGGQKSSAGTKLGSMTALKETSTPTPQKTTELAPTDPPIDSLKADRPNKKHTGRWARETLSDLCIDSVSPSELIKLAASLKEPFNTVDHLDENGNIAGMTLTIPTENTRFVFYRSRNDCTATIQVDQRKIDDLASKYQ